SLHVLGVERDVLDTQSHAIEIVTIRRRGEVEVPAKLVLIQDVRDQLRLPAAVRYLRDVLEPVLRGTDRWRQATGDQSIPRGAVVIGHLQGDAIIEQTGVEANLDLTRALRLQLGVARTANGDGGRLSVTDRYRHRGEEG